MVTSDRGYWDPLSRIFPWHRHLPTIFSGMEADALLDRFDLEQRQPALPVCSTAGKQIC